MLYCCGTALLAVPSPLLDFHAILHFKHTRAQRTNLLFVQAMLCIVPFIHSAHCTELHCNGDFRTKLCFNPVKCTMAAPMCLAPRQLEPIFLCLIDRHGIVMGKKAIAYN